MPGTAGGPRKALSNHLLNDLSYLCWEVTVCQALGKISLRPRSSSVLQMETEAQKGQALCPRSHSEAIQGETSMLVTQHIKGIQQTWVPFCPNSPQREPTWPSCALSSLPDGSSAAQPRAHASAYKPPITYPSVPSVCTPSQGSEVLVGLSWAHPGPRRARPAVSLPDLPLRLLCWCADPGP